MEKELIFSILALLILSINTVVYWKGIFRGEIIPHPFTMFIWVVVLGISAIELLKQQEFFGVASILFLTVDLFLAMLVGLYRWEKIRINWIDWFFLISGFLLIIFWQSEPEYKYVLIVMIMIDVTAYAGSFKKAWIQPYTEKSLPYFISVGNNVCTIFAISVWNFENLGMWIWTAGVNFIFACFILIRQKYLSK